MSEPFVLRAHSIVMEENIVLHSVSKSHTNSGDTFTNFEIVFHGPVIHHPYRYRGMKYFYSRICSQSMHFLR